MTAYTAETQRLAAPPDDPILLLSHLLNHDAAELRWNIRQRTELLRDIREYFNVARTLIQDYKHYQDAATSAKSDLPPQIAALLGEVHL